MEAIFYKSINLEATEDGKKGKTGYTYTLRKSLRAQQIDEISRDDIQEVIKG